MEERKDIFYAIYKTLVQYSAERCDRAGVGTMEFGRNIAQRRFSYRGRYSAQTYGTLGCEIVVVDRGLTENVIQW